MNEVPVWTTRVKRNGHMYIVLRWDDPITGRRRQKSAGTTRWRDAQRAAAKLSEQLTLQRHFAKKSWATLREQF